MWGTVVTQHPLGAAMVSGTGTVVRIGSGRSTAAQCKSAVPVGGSLDVQGATCVDTVDAAWDWTWIFAHLARDRNDAAALAALEARVLRWAERKIVGVAARACREDVVAETCAEVIVNLDRARGPDTFAGFVLGYFLNARRHALYDTRWTHEPLEDYEPPAPIGDGPAPDELALLARCLAALPSRERLAVELRYLHDAATEQIAAALDVKPTNARQLVHAGLARLRRHARREWPHGRG
jgi:RNA polymerase sigma factor (sigma-70 family)